MMTTNALSVTEAARNFSDYISRVAYRHESFVLFKGKRPMVELRPLPVGGRLGNLPEILRAMPKLSEDEAEAFAQDVKSGH